MTKPRVPAGNAGQAPVGASGTSSRIVRSKGPGVLARRPEILPVTSTLLAWLVLAAVSPLSSWITLDGVAPTGDPAGQLLGHAAHDGIFTPAGLAMVALMTVAMMAPLAIPGVRTAAFTSAWWRAGRSALWFFAAFIATWTALAVCLAPIAAMLAGVLGSAVLAAGILTVGCAFAQFDPRRTALTMACDRPMRLRGGRDATVDCARFGLLTACRGLRLCALPMLAMLTVPSSLLVMALLTALSVTDRVTQGARRLQIAAGYLSLAGVLLMTV